MSTNMMTRTYFTMVFHHDKAGMHASIRMSWTENKEWVRDFAQTQRVRKGQDSNHNYVERCLNFNW